MWAIYKHYAILCKELEHVDFDIYTHALTPYPMDPKG